MSLTSYVLFAFCMWVSLNKGFYPAVLYGFIHKKIGNSYTQNEFKPYRYQNEAICEGWSKIILVGTPFLILGFCALYYDGLSLLKLLQRDFQHGYGLVYIVGYGTLFGLALYGYRWIYIGIKYGILEQKTKTCYPFTDKEKYYNSQEKERIVSPNKYFRGRKAYVTGIIRIILGSIYILVVLFLLIDRDYYIGHNLKSIYF
jgi:hypothetical protein